MPREKNIFGITKFVSNLVLKLLVMGYLKRMNTNGPDSRYADVKVLIQVGRITTLEQILKRIPKTVFSNDLNMKVDRFSECVDDPCHFTFRQILRMARLLRIDEKLFLSMMIDHWRKNGENVRSNRFKELS